MGPVTSYGTLVVAQAALVALPVRPWRIASSRLLGLIVPAAALVVGVAIARASGGADFLTALATVATPLLAAGAGWARGWRAPWAAVPASAGLYLIAWREPGNAGDAAGILLIAGACLTATAVVAALAPESWLTAGLVGLVILDCIFVWGDRQVEPAMQALQGATPPSVGGGTPLPALQQADFGTATMGWLDFAAPALLAILVRYRLRAAVATGVAGGLWGLLLLVTSPIAATPPVLAGLAAGRVRSAPWSGWRSREPEGSSAASSAVRSPGASS
ncbi:MAG TPA: hypothetical protein VFU10_11065 [Gaiellaceae bacterium]|nr:hypothetical protein [Gaiellaceae bacterium]